MSEILKKLFCAPVTAIILLAVLTALCSCSEMVSLAGISEVLQIPSVPNPDTSPMPPNVQAPPETTTTEVSSPVTTAESLVTTTTEANPRNDILICVDAGHGGHDPGAISEYKGNTCNEKDINLAVAMILANELRELGYNVITTRDGDTYPENEARRELAKDMGANMFISIHSNAAGETANGTLVLFNPNGRYNYNKLTSIMCTAIHDGVSTKYDTHKDTVGTQDRTNLIVLKALDIPSLMIELAFMTNASDMELLMDDAWRADMAKAIAQGIDDAYQAGLLD